MIPVQPRVAVIIVVQSFLHNSGFRKSSLNPLLQTLNHYAVLYNHVGDSVSGGIFPRPVRLREPVRALITTLSMLQYVGLMVSLRADPQHLIGNYCQCSDGT